MVNQYPHTISISWKEKSTQDANFNWVEGASKTFESVCRAEPNGKAAKIAGADGTLIEFTFAVYLPKHDTVIPVDAEYLLNNTIVGRVKYASNGQLNSRIWL